MPPRVLDVENSRLKARRRSTEVSIPLTSYLVESNETVISYVQIATLESEVFLTFSYKFKFEIKTTRFEYQHNWLLNS